MPYLEMTPERREHRRQYSQMRRKFLGRRVRAEEKERYKQQEEYCRSVCGISYFQVKQIRALLRKQADETGEDFLELARTHNVLMRRERARMENEQSQLERHLEQEGSGLDERE